MASAVSWSKLLLIAMEEYQSIFIIPKSFPALRGSAAAQCGKAQPFRRGFSKTLFPEAEPQERNRVGVGRKAIGFPHCAAAEPQEAQRMRKCSMKHYPSVKYSLRENRKLSLRRRRSIA